MYTLKKQTNKNLPHLCQKTPHILKMWEYNAGTLSGPSS